QHRQNPATLVKPVSAQGLRQFELGSLVRQQFVQRNRRAGLVPLNTGGAVPLAGQKTFDRHEQIRTRTPFLAADGLQVLSLKQTREKLLDQILCVLWSKTLPSHKPVEWSPVNAAKLLKRLLVRPAIHLALPTQRSSAWWQMPPLRFAPFRR